MNLETDRGKLGVGVGQATLRWLQERLTGSVSLAFFFSPLSWGSLAG